MSIIYNDTQEKTELQRHVLSELREKQSRKPLSEGQPKLTDFNEADYSKDYHHGNSLVWLGLVVLALVVSFTILWFSKQ